MDYYFMWYWETQKKFVGRVQFWIMSAQYNPKFRGSILVGKPERKRPLGRPRRR